MKQSELNNINYIINGLEFTPDYEVDEYVAIKDDNEKIIDFELLGFKLLKTAKESYLDSLKEISKEPSEGEVLMSNIILENAQLKTGLQEQQELTATLLLQMAELKGGNTNV
ncbi:hypothetical protein FDC58_06885 [Clostridium botulinum]|uniref:hypothetical protein n=1 Tax=unclassified Clostridium TaxID=2614128 RepID=UPI0013C81459|nr:MULTISPECIES: hypothetical protein [unclassified Clostridium]MBY7009569.1 hypothetical protein [Clostridium botulinum]NFH74501.1 hypothetical protein [Clostridium botulinum]NFI05420.1 hypothetical protein [Clostridium botulinum]NFJ73946.1 hypothetical protein [Clostridium botulinum]NFK66529.1 hypothetical protein [Clostridium botulinum]